MSKIQRRRNLVHACERSFCIFCLCYHRNVSGYEDMTGCDVTRPGCPPSLPHAPCVSRENIAYATIECESVAYLPYDDNLSSCASVVLSGETFTRLFFACSSISINHSLRLLVLLFDAAPGTD